MPSPKMARRLSRGWGWGRAPFPLRFTGRIAWVTTSISGGQNGGPGETTGAWEASRLADLSLLTASPPTSRPARASGPHQPSEAPGQASYLHGVPALEPSPIDPCPAATPGQASWGQRVAVRVDTLGLQQAVWMLLLLFRILPPAASPPPFKSPPPAQLGAGTRGQAQEGPPRRLPAFCRASCLCPPAAASPPATAEDAQSFAEPADSAARAPSRGGNKALISVGGPSSSTADEEEQPDLLVSCSWQ